MKEPEARGALREDLRTAWHRYVDMLEPHRPALHAYCRHLAGNVWDAEDLVQDALLRAFGQWGVTYPGIRNPRAYLLRTATNAWIDTLRRRKTEARAPDVDPDARPATIAGPDASSELRDASSRLLQRLSPQEGAAVVLKEAFEMTLEEIAELLATTTGAVKAALHRGRGRLREPEGDTASRRPHASPELPPGPRGAAVGLPLRGAGRTHRSHPVLRLLPGDHPNHCRDFRRARAHRCIPRPLGGTGPIQVNDRIME